MEPDRTNEEKTMTNLSASRRDGDSRSHTADTSSEQAREALLLAGTAGIDRADDRSVHVLATAGFGVLIGAYFALTRTEWLSTGVAAGGYFLIAGSLAAWQARAARSAPRGTRRAGRWGLALTIVAIIVALGVVNSAYRDAAVPAWVLAASGLFVAAPLLVAADVIRRGAR